MPQWDRPNPLTRVPSKRNMQRNSAEPRILKGTVLEVPLGGPEDLPGHDYFTIRTCKESILYYTSLNCTILRNIAITINSKS